MGDLSLKQLSKDKAIFDQAIYPTYFKDEYPVDWDAWPIYLYEDFQMEPDEDKNFSFMTYKSTQKDGTLGPASEHFARQLSMFNLMWRR